MSAYLLGSLVFSGSKSEEAETVKNSLVQLAVYQQYVKVKNHQLMFAESSADDYPNIS